MKSIFIFFGRALFYLTWPFLYLRLHWSTRTRILLIHGQEILVIKGWIHDNKWRLPGGGVHRRESPSRSAIRELAEELGIQIEPRQLVLLGEARGATQGLNYHYYQFAARLTTKPNLKISAFEVTEVAWLPISKFTKQNADVALLDTLRSWSELANRARL